MSSRLGFRQCLRSTKTSAIKTDHLSTTISSQRPSRRRLAQDWERRSLATRLASTNNKLGELGDFDSGIMDVFYTFGWLGAVLLWVVGNLIWTALKASAGTDSGVICLAIAGGTAAQLIFADTLLGSSGMLVFPFAALAIAESKRFTQGASLRSQYGVRKAALTIEKPIQAVGERPLTV